MACFSAAHNKTSIPIFKSFLDNHCQDLSLSTFSGISLMNCPCIFFSHQFCFSSWDTFSIDCLSSSNSPDKIFFRIGNIKPKLFSSSLKQHSTLIRLSRISKLSLIFLYCFFLSFHSLWSYPVQLSRGTCILPARLPSLLHYLRALFLHIYLLSLSLW